MENRICIHCGIEKPLDKFPHTQDKKYYYKYCYACKAKRGRSVEKCKIEFCSGRPWREGYCKDHKDLVSEAGLIAKAYIRKSAYLGYIHNITLDDYRTILNDIQGGVCPLCQTPAPSIYEMFEGRFWHVDHDHECCPRITDNAGNLRSTSCGNCVRGILCHPCNLILNENVNEDWLNNALIYLREGGR